MPGPCRAESVHRPIKEWKTLKSHSNHRKQKKVKKYFRTLRPRKKSQRKCSDTFFKQDSHSASCQWLLPPITQREARTESQTRVLVDLIPYQEESAAELSVTTSATPTTRTWGYLPTVSLTLKTSECFLHYTVSLWRWQGSQFATLYNGTSEQETLLKCPNCPVFRGVLYMH